MTSSRMIFACGVVLLASCIYGIPVEDADLTDKIVQNEATTRSEDSIVEIFTHSHEDEALSTPEQKERASAELQELQTEQEARATDSGNCAWTRQHSCPGQQLGSRGRANADGSAGYRECCLHGGWRRASQGYTVAPAVRALDGSEVKALYHRALNALLSGDRVEWEATIDESAQVWFMGWGGGNQCSPLSRKAAFDGLWTGANSANKAYFTINKVFGAYNTAQAHITLALYFNPLGTSGPVFAKDVFQQVTCNADCSKIVTWNEISSYGPQNEIQLGMFDALAEARGTGNPQAYIALFSPEIAFRYANPGSNTNFTVTNFTDFEKYAKYVVPTSGPGGQIPLGKAAGGCNQIVARMLTTQTRPISGGGATIQDSFMWFTLEDTPPYRFLHGTQILTAA